MRLVLTGGGTGGHIYPGLALWRFMESRGEPVQVLYIGSQRGLERDIAIKAGLDFVAIPAAGLKRKLNLSGLKTAWTTYRGYRAALRLLRRFRPDVVVGTGGYVTLPVVFAAARFKIPSVIWEGNARPGLTNQLCARKAYAVAVSFEESRDWFAQANKVVYTGNPRASEVAHVSRERVAAAKREYGIEPGRKVIVYFGGSRGSETVNRVFIDAFSRIAERKDWQLVFVTGEAHYQSVVEQAGEVPANVRLVPFVHDMPALLACAAAVVSRAGSSTLAELCAFGLASILVPSPYVTANHQEENALRLVERGAAKMLRESELTVERLYDELYTILDTAEGDRLRRAAKSLATPDAVERFYQLVLEAVGSSPPSSS